MSIQGAGSLCGNLLAGHLSDMFGRKRPYFASMALMAIANFVSYLANTWTLVAVTRFVVGFAVSAFMTTVYSLLSEFTLAQYRYFDSMTTFYYIILQSRTLSSRAYQNFNTGYSYRENLNKNRFIFAYITLWMPGNTSKW